MIYFFCIVVVLILADIVLCSVFCHHNRQKAARDLIHGVFEGKQSAQNPVCGGGIAKQHLSKKDRLVGTIISYLNSFLRLSLKVTSGIPSHTIRNLLYRKVFCVDLAKNAVLYYGAEIRSPWNLHIGAGSVIGDKAVLDARHGIFIGENVNFSTGVWIWTLQHDVNSPAFSTEGQGKPVIVRNRAWLSCRVTVLPGTEIKEGAVVAAGACVTKNLEPFSINGGVPARQIGQRNTDLSYEFDGKHVHFL